MKPAKHHVMCVVLLVAVGGPVVQAMPAQEPATDAVAQRRQAFLEGVLFAAQEQESVLNKPPAGFNTKDVLTGIEGVEVVVEELPAVVEEYGLRRQDVQTAVESQLRRRRIDVALQQQAEGSPEEKADQAQEDRQALMQTASAETDEQFLAGVREYLQQRQPQSSSAILDVTINAAVDEAAGFASYSVHVQFLQTVLLLRPDARRSLATTWQMGKVGYVSLRQFKTVGEQAADVVDEFIGDYLAANPGRAAPATTGTKTPPKGLVTGIVRSGDSATAVVGTQIVREGDTLDSVRVVKIHDDRVEFEKDGARWTQKLNEPPGPQWR